MTTASPVSESTVQAPIVFMDHAQDEKPRVLMSADHARPNERLGRFVNRTVAIHDASALTPPASLDGSEALAVKIDGRHIGEIGTLGELALRFFDACHGLVPRTFIAVIDHDMRHFARRVLALAWAATGRTGLSAPAGTG